MCAVLVVLVIITAAFCLALCRMARLSDEAAEEQLRKRQNEGR